MTVAISSHFPRIPLAEKQAETQASSATVSHNVETAAKIQGLKLVQSPRIHASVLPVTPPPAQTQIDAMAALVAMMAVILLVESKMTKDMAKNGEAQDSMSTDYTQAMKTRGDDQVKKIEQAEEDARKAGIFQKIAMALQFAVAVLTAPIDPMGSAMMLTAATLQLLQSQNVIPQQWVNSPIGDFFAKMGVTIVLSAGTAAAGNVVGNMAASAEEVGVEATTSYFNWGVCATLVGTLNPTADITKFVGGSGKTQEIISIISTIVTTIACALMAMRGAQNIGENPISNLLKKRFNLLDLEVWTQRLNNTTSFLSVTEGAMGITSGGFTVQQGKDIQGQAAPQRDYELMKSTTQLAQSQAQSQAKWQQAQMSYFQQLNSAFSQLNDPSAVAADVLLQG